MTTQHPRNIGRIAILTVAAIGLAAFTMGFYVFPTRDSSGTLWQRMCRAAGFVRLPADYSALVVPSTFTSVVVPHALLGVGTPDQIGHGATLALRCSVCHGPRGLSGADAPNLAGQYAEVIYKQLLDYQRGARTDSVMNAMSGPLSEEDIRDLAFYYGYLPRQSHHADLSSAPALIRVGDPMRNIPPCASCHGAHDGKDGAPELGGEPGTYLRQQLTSFADGTRKNDVSADMRSVARHVSPAEMTAVIHYYADNQP
jgi:cytochrome c553